MRALNLDQLDSFADVVSLGSFSAAAARRGLSQPAISLQIRALERRLGVRLVERVGKRAQATAAGRDLLAHARRLADEADAAVTRMQGFRAGTRGRVRVGTGATACIYLLPPILGALRAAHPEIEIIVETGNSPEILDAVEANALDVALVTLPAARRALAVRPLRPDPFAAILPARPRVAASALRPADFAERPLILYEPRGATRAVIDAWLIAGGVQPRPAMELGSVEAIKKLVEAGLGWSILPAVTVAGAQGRGLQVRPLAPALGRTLGLAMRRDKVVDRPLRALLTGLQRLGARPA
ncbi:MAG: LysR family transcriptional regulator [Alphaproteobacteria bacterium]|nr:LysR family transcriptional regulator [Alphaproteobacteria bacterium]